MVLFDLQANEIACVIFLQLRQTKFMASIADLVFIGKPGEDGKAKAYSNAILGSKIIFFDHIFICCGI